MAQVTADRWTWEWIALTEAILAVLLLLGALLAVKLRRRTGRSSTACGRCGYDVRGLPTFFCPECGSDLREVGITSGDGPPASTLLLSAMAGGWKWMLLWTVIVMVLSAAVVAGTLAWVLRYNVEPVGKAVLEPPSKAYRVLLTSTGKMRGVSGWRNMKSPSIVGNEAHINVAMPSGVADYNTDLIVDLSTWSSAVYHWVGGRADTQKPIAFNRGELERFLHEEMKLDTSTPAAASEIDALMRLIDACRTKLINQVPTESAKPFSVLSVADHTTSYYSGPGPVGAPALGLTGGLWMLAMSGVIVRRMYRFRNGIPALGFVPQSEEGGAASPPAAAAKPVARTVTVMFSDIKDYTARSVASGRTGAIELVRRHRELAAPVIARRGGAIVKTIGDALLVTFESATDAVLAGLEIQAAVTAHNASAASGDELHLRIAVASGEVVVEAGDVYGETVNLASRLQSVASPGQVILSSATRSLVNKREVPTVAVGSYELAGFGAPIEAFVAQEAG